MNKVTVKVYSAPRELPDPASQVFKKLVKREFQVNINDLVDGIPTDPNPRDAKPKTKTYLDIIDSLNSDDGTFHLKNHGIKIVAEDTIYNAHTKELTITFKEGVDKKSSHGILDGGHTYEIITNHRNENIKHQFVPITIYTGIPHEYIPELAAGLNNSTALTAVTKLNHQNNFEWIQKSLEGQPYADKVVYYQNDEGNIKVETIIALMTAVNIELFPLKGDAFPTMAYNSKQGCLMKFAENRTSYEKFDKILPELLQLYDYISESCYSNYNKKAKGNAGGLTIFNATNKPATIGGTRRKHKFDFSGESSFFRLEQGVNVAAFSTLRCFIRLKGGKFVWDRPVSDVKKAIDNVAAVLVKDSHDVYREVNNLSALGKSPNLWKLLLQTVRLSV